MHQLGEMAPVWRRYKEERDEGARLELIEHYTHLVRISVGRVAPMAPASVDRDELYSAGAIGLIDAVDRFEPTRGLKFETLAITKIRGAILEYMRREDWAPRSVRSRIKAVEAAILHLESEKKATPTLEEVAALLGVTPDDVAETLEQQARALPISSATKVRSTADDSVAGQLLLEDTLVAGDTSPFDATLTRLRRENLLLAIDRLPARERLALTLYYYEGLMCREVGAAMGVCENRAYQILAQAVGRLQQYLGHMTGLFDLES